MPKRKLSDLTNSSRTSQAERLAQTFGQGVQTLSRALKTARGFERQKLGRREQKAKTEKDNDMLARVGEEIGALKSLEYRVTAERYLLKQLVKTKRIAESQVFSEFKQSRNIATGGPGSTAEANVTARLFKTKPVQNVMTGLLGEIRRLLGLEDGAGENKPGKRGGVELKEAIQGRLDGKDALSSRREAPDDDEEEWEGIATDDTAEGADYSQFDSRLASGSDSGSDPASGSEDIPTAIQEGGSDSESEANRPITQPSNALVSRSPSPPPKQPRRNTKQTPPTPPTSTTFLPSLSMGGYFSGSESDPEPEDYASTPHRKNRMGQQARRALWEKKYGSSANHVKRQRKEVKTSRDSGWDLRRGATDPEGDKRKRMTRHGKGGDRRMQRNSATAPKRRAHDDNKPLHPSWEAKRKSKEQQQHMAAFQGKKVTFD